ncbi:MAG: hypothetical protein IKG14_03775 [Clostridia bacterium]|nr:hypothetical protein [Clostridia bacterium]
MNIAYVKIRKKKELNRGNYIKNIIENNKINIKKLLNIVEQDKYHKEIFYLNSLEKESKTKLANKLKEEKMKYAIVEKGYTIDYPLLNGVYTLKSMIPELVDFCFKALKPEINEIYICTEIFSFENISIIEELTKKAKVVNIVTNNKRYRNLEKRLEEKEIFITVSGNKRQSLKKAKILVNLDFSNLDLYNINRNMIVIDITKCMKIPKSFDGIIIRGIKANTKKVIRVFSDFEEFSKQDLIEAELAKINDYKKSREYIINNKIYIERIFNKEPITMQEFIRLKRIKKIL